MNLLFLENQYTVRSNIALQKYIGFFGVDLTLYANEESKYTDTYGVNSEIDTYLLGRAKGLLFNYDMTPISYSNTSVFTGGYLWYIDDKIDLAKTVVISNPDGSDRRIYKIEQAEGLGVTQNLYKVRKLVSAV